MEAGTYGSFRVVGIRFAVHGLEHADVQLFGRPYRCASSAAALDHCLCLRVRASATEPIPAAASCPLYRVQRRSSYSSVRTP